MNVVEMLAEVAVVTEFIKKAILNTFKIDIHGTGAVILSCLVSIGVVFVTAIKTDTLITLALIPILIQVVIGANMGFVLLKSRSK